MVDDIEDLGPPAHRVHQKGRPLQQKCKRSPLSKIQKNIRLPSKNDNRRAPLQFRGKQLSQEATSKETNVSNDRRAHDGFIGPELIMSPKGPQKICRRKGKEPFIDTLSIAPGKIAEHVSPSTKAPPPSEKQIVRGGSRRTRVVEAHQGHNSTSLLLMSSVHKFLKHQQRTVIPFHRRGS